MQVALSFLVVMQSGLMSTVAEFEARALSHREKRRNGQHGMNPGLLYSTGILFKDQSVVNQGDALTAYPKRLLLGLTFGTQPLVRSLRAFTCDFRCLQRSLGKVEILSAKHTSIGCHN